MPVLYLSYLSGMHFQSDDGIVHRERILVVVHFLSNYRHDESTRSSVYLKLMFKEIHMIDFR